MNQSPIYIHFRVEWQVLGPQSPGQRFEREKFQQFFDKLNKVREFGGYDDFSYRPSRCELAKHRGATPIHDGKAFGKVVYSSDAADTLILVEEWTEDTAAEFAKKTKIVLDAWFDCFPETLIVAQTCSVRALVSIQKHDDARQFIGDKLLGLGGAFQKRLDAMPHKVGFSFGCQRIQGSATIQMDSNVSSWRDDRSVWIEVRGLALLKQPLNMADHDRAESVFAKCTSFLEGEIVPLLNDYDQSDNGGVPDDR